MREVLIASPSAAARGLSTLKIFAHGASVRLMGLVKHRRRISVVNPMPARRRIPAILLCALLVALAGTAHASGPTLTATPHQQRTRAADAGILPLWDTSWWITLRATLDCQHGPDNLDKRE